MKRQKSILIAGLGLGITACGGGGGGTFAPADPEALGVTYGTDSALYLVEVPIAVNQPTVSGTADTWSIAPALPPGLAFSASDGSISGIPTGTFAATDYTVHVENDEGEALDVNVRIGVVEPPRMAFVANSGDDTISTFSVDAFTGELRSRSFLTAPLGAVRPEDIVVHPDGFVYVPNFGDGISPSIISTYALDAATGTLTAGTPISAGIGPHTMELSPDGLFAYVTAFGSDSVFVFSIDQATGALTQVGSPVPTQNGPSALALDPKGRFAYVTNSLSNSLSSFRINPATGELSTNIPATLLAGTPVDVTIDPEGENFYLVLEDTDSVLPFSIDQLSGTPQALSSRPTGQLPSSVAIHPTGRFAYVTNATANTISRYSIDRDNGELAPQGTVDTGLQPSGLRFDASGLYAYAVNFGSNDVSIFSVDLASGDLILVGAWRTRSEPAALALLFGPTPVEEHARFAYVVNSESGDLSSFELDAATGALTSLGATTPAGTEPTDAVTDHAGQYLWVTDRIERNIRTFEIGAGGALTQLGSPAIILGRPRGIDLEPEGRFLYVASSGADLITSYSIDPFDGSLTQVATAAAGTNPSHVTVDPTGRFVYASNQDSQNITSYRIENGQFIAGPFVATAPGNPQELRFIERGDRAYAAMADSNILVPYDVDADTGLLTPIPPGRATGARPDTIELHPNGRFAYVAVSDLGGTGNGHVAFYNIVKSSGSLQGQVQVFPGLNPIDLRVEPQGRFLYVLNQGGDDLAILDLDPKTGVPTVRQQMATGLQPKSLIWTTVLQ